MKDTFFQPVQLGSLTLQNRIVVPLMVRSRLSQPSNDANNMMAETYIVWVLGYFLATLTRSTTTTSRACGFIQQTTLHFAICVL